MIHKEILRLSKIKAAMINQSDLALLREGDICTIVLHNGSQRDAAWHPLDKTFHFLDGLGEGFVTAAEVYEWWPAGVKF
jgi:hypothetical protein